MKKTTAKRIAVTGGSGKAGRACVRDLVEHGYDVLNIDSVRPSEPVSAFVGADLNDFGQTIDALSTRPDGSVAACDAVVHLAAIPAPRLRPDAATFENNIRSTYNVFEAARRLGIRNIVWASSETVLGLPFDTPPPYVPVDEDYEGRPESAYSLSKLLGEEMARQYCRWNPETKIIGLRFSNVMEPHDYARFSEFQDDPTIRRWNLWGYIDARDAAQAVRKSIEAAVTGAHVLIIAAADTVMSRPNAELLAEVFPDVSHKRDFGANETLLSIKKARRLIGFEPAFSWRSTKV